MDPEEHCEHVHHSNRAPWLRAMVLGANDGLVSVAALLMGVSAGDDDLRFMRLSGVAGLIAGALSMAVGEYVSVSSQRDAEKADIHKEIQEQLKGPEAQARELDELTEIYVSRGIPRNLARQVAEHLTENDVIRAHARDELGIDLDELANPWQASIVSAICFSSGAAIPLLAGAFLADQTSRLISISLATTAGLYVVGFFLRMLYKNAVTYLCLQAFIRTIRRLFGWSRADEGSRTCSHWWLDCTRHLLWHWSCIPCWPCLIPLAIPYHTERVCLFPKETTTDTTMYKYGRKKREFEFSVSLLP